MIPGTDIFLMSDILFCHICAPYPKVVVVVVKVSVPGSLLRAHILECVTQLAAKTLYSHYYKACNNYKLNRYRNSKRKSEIKKDSHSYNDFISSNCEDNSDVFNSLRSCAVRKDSGTSSVSEGGSVRGSLRSIRNGFEQVLDKNVNVIEIKSNENTDESQPFSLVQHIDSEGITHIEIESGPISLINGGSVSSDFSSIISLSTPENNVINSITLNSINSTKKRVSSANHSNTVNNATKAERESISLNERDKKFRQRQPAMILRDSGESFNQKLGKKSEVEQKEYTSRQERHIPDQSRSRDFTRPPLPPPSSWGVPERPSRPREISRNRNQNNRDSRDHEQREKDFREREFREFKDRELRAREFKELAARNKYNKGPAPPPPPRRHPHDSSLLLVPTKSGHEPKRSYYPKESHIVRGNKVVRVDFPTVPVWGHRSDPNNNARQYMHYTGGWAHEYHAPRIREPSLNSEIRRRSRSKSPARRQVTNRYIDAVTTFNFSQKLKEISEAVFSTKKAPNSIVNFLPPITNRTLTRSGSNPLSSGEIEPLKPVIKKLDSKASETDNRRVTFSAYATVQLMDS